MLESDRSEIEEEDMDKLQVSSDSIDMISPRKRLRVEASEDETDLPVKKRHGSFDERPRVVKNDNTETVSDKTNIDECTVKEEGSAVCLENEQMIKETAHMDRETKEKQDRTQSPLTEMNGALNNSSGEVNIQNERMGTEKETPSKEPTTTACVLSTLGNKERKSEATAGEDTEVVKKEADETIDGKEDDGEEDGTRKPAKKRRVDTEVVDGLELSVECASDKDESSSESEDEKDVKPRPKTIIVKAEPNESELDCSSDGEKSDFQRALVDTLQVKSEGNKTRRRGSRTSFSKLKVSGSEDSQNSNSDEDYSPRTKKRMKKSSLTATRKLTTTNKHRSVESKRGRASRDTRGPSYKKNAEYRSDRDEDADADATVVERADKTTKTKNGIEEEEELSEKESSSKDESDNNSEKEETSTKSRRKRRDNAKPQNRHIQALKKYLNVAGVKVKSYNDIWADCKSNAAKIKRLKELLEKNGVSGRPTLEKCKRVREENEKMKEVSELDTSNIISEGRITRARRNMENVKKITPPDTPPRHREARNTFRRIQTVVDSDSE